MRFDADYHGTVQLEVPLDMTQEDARKRAEHILQAAVDRANQDKAVRVVKVGNDQYLDPRGKPSTKEA